MNKHIHIGKNLRERLVHAAEEGHDECVAELIQAGADVNAMPKRWRCTAINRCIKCCSIYRKDKESGVEVAKNYGRCLDLLLEAGAQIKKEYLNDCAWHGNVEFLRKFIDKGANVCGRSGLSSYAVYSFASPLRLAIMGGNEECVKFLLDAWADLNGLPPGQSTPLSEAVSQDHKQFVELLLNTGANVNTFLNSKRQTMLFWASTKSTCSNEVFHNLIEA